jgi:hypothetical protein
MNELTQHMLLWPRACIMLSDKQKIPHTPYFYAYLDGVIRDVHAIRIVIAETEKML